MRVKKTEDIGFCKSKKITDGVVHVSRKVDIGTVNRWSLSFRGLLFCEVIQSAYS